MSNDRYYIGGGNVAGILGISPFRTPLDEYLTIIGEAPPPTEERLAFFKRRKSFEPVAADMFREKTGLEIMLVNQRYQDVELPFVKAEIDFESSDDQNGEIKTVHPLAAKDWGRPAVEGEEGDDNCPIYVTAQAMHGLGVHPRDLCRVLGMIGFDDVRVYTIRRDEDLIKGIRERITEFWNVHVLPRVPPAPKTVGDVLHLFKADLGTIAEADDTTYAVIERLRELKPTIAEIKQLEERVKVFMGPAGTLTREGEILATWKDQSGGLHWEGKRLDDAHPELAAEFKKERRFRVLRLK